MILVQLIAGLAILVGGAEVMVRGATRIAVAMRITPLVIGLTVVAFGTSSPELAVSVMSSLSGNPNIALGNVIGSNIFNILFVLGVSALFVPLIVQMQLIRLDVPVMIGLSLLVLLFGFDGRIGVLEGLLFIALGVAYTVFVIRLSRKEKDAEVLKEYEHYGTGATGVSSKLWFAILLVGIGLVLLVLGSRWLVDAAVEIAQAYGVSDLVIGVTIVAIGTSLPEVATSLVAALRGERDIAVGNAVGSSIFNIVFILGSAAVIGGGMEVPLAALRLDIPVMIAVSVACLPFFFSGRRLDRWEGVLFLFYYVAYALYLILASLEHHSLDIFAKAMIWFTIPLTVLTLIILTIGEFSKGSKKEEKEPEKPPKKIQKW